MIGGLKPYSAMKDSGVKWLGEVPAHWDVRKLKNWLAVNELVLSEYTNPDHAFHYLDIGCVSTGYLAVSPERMRFKSAPSRARRVVRAGDTVISTVRTYLKAIWHAEDPNPDLIASTGFAVLTPKPKTCPKFVSYLCQSEAFIDRIVAESVGVVYPAIAESRLAAFHVSVPPLPEQTAISRFLDHADRRIRRYIRAKEKLIALLEEQKQAIIHQAVTGQIDARTGQPYPAYKPAGIEWLGDVPAHWEVRRLRNAAEIRFSNVDKHSKNGERPVRLCNYTDVYHNDRIRTDMHFMKATATVEEIERFRLASGDVLITKDSESWKDIGVPTFVDSTDHDLICGYHLAMLRPMHGEIVGEFLYQALLCRGVENQLFVRANGVTRFGLSQAAIKCVWLPVPPLSEQVAIVRFVDESVQDIDSSIARSQYQINLLGEYRTRLIADVVTGKLDVREAATALPEIDPLAADRDSFLDCAEEPTKAAG